MRQPGNLQCWSRASRVRRIDSVTRYRSVVTTPSVSSRPTRFHPGANVGCGKDYTLFAKAEGQVVFETKGPFNRQYVSILPVAQPAA